MFDSPYSYMCIISCWHNFCNEGQNESGTFATGNIAYIFCVNMFPIASSNVFCHKVDISIDHVTCFIKTSRGTRWGKIISVSDLELYEI